MRAPMGRPAARRGAGRTARLALALALGGTVSARCAQLPMEREVELPVESSADGLLQSVGPGVAVSHPRPDSILGLVLEGAEAKPSILRLFRSPHRFPVGFSTYLPEGLEPVAAGRDTVRIAFPGSEGGSRPVLEVIVLPAGTDSEEALSLTREALERPGADVTETGPEAGLVASYVATGEVASGRADLVWDGYRWVLLRARYPNERGPEVEPRLRTVRVSWVWDATGEPLLGPRG